MQKTSLWFFDDACDPTFFDPFKRDLNAFVTQLVSQANLLNRVKINECDTQYIDNSSGTRSNLKHRTFYLPDVPEGFRKGSENTEDWKTYYHAYPRAGGGVVIQYWRFYAYNDAFNNHGGDWEGIHVILAGDLRPESIGFLGHSSIDYVPAGSIQWEDTHPKIFSEGGGHASHFDPSNVSAESFTRQETWAGGRVLWTRNILGHPIGEATLGGGLINVGAKIAPMQGQSFIKYSGLWGSISEFPVDTSDLPLGDLNRRFGFSGYWGPAYNETGMSPPTRASGPQFLPAWGAGAAQTHLAREWQPTSTSP